MIITVVTESEAAGTKDTTEGNLDGTKAVVEGVKNMLVTDTLISINSNITAYQKVERNITSRVL